MSFIIDIIILLLAVPTGYLIAYLAKDELVIGRRWFILIIIVAFIGEIISFFWLYSYITLALAFIIIATFISYKKSFDKKWTGKHNNH